MNQVYIYFLRRYIDAIAANKKACMIPVGKTAKKLERFRP